jgi:hypothetical protein
LAAHNYHDDRGRLPPAVVYGKDGQPLLSWRVLILPYLEQNDLYKQFKLDEPWDSPRNLELLPQMPMIYAAPGSKKSLIPPDHTFIHVFVGKGTVFGNSGAQTLQSILSDSTQTIHLVEAGKPVPWTKPEELVCEPDQPFPELPGPFKDIVRVAFFDGHVRYLKRTTSEATFRALVSCNPLDKQRIDWIRFEEESAR